MVRATLREIQAPGTGKTQTRRVLPQPEPGAWFDSIDKDGRAMFVKGCAYGKQRLRYRVGDRLYVREAWRTTAAYDDLSPSEMGGEESIRYEADERWEDWTPKFSTTKLGRVRQGMHMPRWASRITLTVTEVRVQQLQEITGSDAVAEGIQRFGRFYAVEGDQDWDDAELDPRAAFRLIWDSLNEARGYGWHANPWVAAYTFTPVLGNIDQVRP